MGESDLGGGLKAKTAIITGWGLQQGSERLTGRISAGELTCRLPTSSFPEILNFTPPYDCIFRRNIQVLN